MKFFIKKLPLLTFLILTFSVFSQAQTQMEKGIELYNQGNNQQAIVIFSSLTKSEKNNAKAWNYLGLAYLAKKDFKNAKKALETAAKLEPQNSIYHTNLAYVYLENGKLNSVKDESNKALKIDNENAYAYLLRGIAYFRENSLDKAITDAEKAISLKSDMQQAYILKSDALITKVSKDWNDNSEKIPTLQVSLETLKKCQTICSKDTNNSDYLEQKIKASEAFLKYFEQRGINDENKNESENDSGYSPIKILTKPKPGYTEQARSAGTSGSVRLAVLFGATGKIEQILVVQGLPNGLTEKAINAAQKIQFEPEKKDGKPISVVKVIVFGFSIRY